MLRNRFAIMVLSLGMLLGGSLFGNEGKASPGGMHDAPPPPPPPPSCAVPGDTPLPGGRVPQHIRRYFERLRQENPAEFKRLMELRVNNQEEFLKEIKKAIPASDYEQKHRRFEADRKCFQLAARLREATDEAKKKRLSAELDAAIDESLALALGQAEAQAAEIQKFIEQLKNERERLHQDRRKFFLEAKPPKDKRPQP